MEENEDISHNGINTSTSNNTNNIEDSVAKYKSLLTSSNDSLLSTLQAILKEGLIKNILHYISNNSNTKKCVEYSEFVYHVFSIVTNNSAANTNDIFSKMLLQNDDSCDKLFRKVINIYNRIGTTEAKSILSNVFKCVYLIIHKLLDSRVFDPLSQGKDVNSRDSNTKDYFKLYFSIDNENATDTAVSAALHFVYEIVKDHSQKLSLLGLNDAGTLTEVLSTLFLFITNKNRHNDVSLQKEIEFKALIVVQTIIQDNSIASSARDILMKSESEKLFNAFNAIVSEEGVIILGNILTTFFESDKDNNNQVRLIFEYEFFEGKQQFDKEYFNSIPFIKRAHSKEGKDEIAFCSTLFSIIYALFMQNAAAFLQDSEINDKLIMSIKRLLRGNSPRNESSHVLKLRECNNVFQIARMATFAVNIIQHNLHTNKGDIYDLVWNLFITMCDLLIINTKQELSHPERLQVKDTFQTLTLFITENAYRDDTFISRVFEGTNRGSLNFHKYFKPLFVEFSKCDSFMYDFLNEIDKKIIYKKENYFPKSEICKLIEHEDYDKLALRLSLAETEKFVEINKQTISVMNDKISKVIALSDSTSSSDVKKQKEKVDGIMIAVIALIRNETILNECKYEPLFKLMEYLCYESDNLLEQALKENETVFFLLWHINDVLSRQTTRLTKAINNDENNALLDFILFLLNEERLTAQIFNLICAILNTLLSSELHFTKVNQFITLNGIGMLIYHLHKNGSDDIHFAMLIRKLVEYIKPINSNDKVNKELSYCLNEMTICEVVNQITRIDDAVDDHSSKNSNNQQQSHHYHKTINANHYCALIELLNQLCLYMFSSKQSKQLQLMGVSVVEQTNIIPFIISELQSSYSPEDSLLTHDTCTFYVLLHLLALISNQRELRKYLCVKSLFTFIESVYTCVKSEKLPLDKVTLSFSTIMFNVLKDSDCGKWIYMKSKVKRCVDCIRKDMLKKESKVTANDVGDFIRLVKTVMEIEASKWKVKECDKIITTAIETEIKRKYGEDTFNGIDIQEEDPGMFVLHEDKDNDNDVDNDDSSSNINITQSIRYADDSSMEINNTHNSNININNSSLLLSNSSGYENENTLLETIHETSRFTAEVVNNNNDTNVNKLQRKLSSIRSALKKKDLSFDIPYQTFMNELVNTVYTLITSLKNHNIISTLAHDIMNILITSKMCTEQIENELIAIDKSDNPSLTLQHVINKFASFIEEPPKVNSLDGDSKSVFKSLASLTAFIIHSNALYTKHKANFTNTPSVLFKCIDKLTASDMIAQCICVAVELFIKDKTATLDNLNNNGITADTIVDTFVKFSANNYIATSVSEVIISDALFMKTYHQHRNSVEFIQTLISHNLSSPDKVFSFLTGLLQCNQIYISHITKVNNELQKLFTSCVSNSNIAHMQQIISFYNAIDSETYDELAYTSGIYEKVVKYFIYNKQLPIEKFSETNLKSLLTLVIKVHRLADDNAMYQEYDALLTRVLSNEHADTARSLIVDLLSCTNMYNSSSSTSITNFITKTFTSLVNAQGIPEESKPTLEQLVNIITQSICSKQDNNKKYLSDAFRTCTTSYLFNLLCEGFTYIIGQTKDADLFKEAISICVSLTAQHKEIFTGDSTAVENMLHLVRAIDGNKYQTEEEFVNEYGYMLDILAFINGDENVKMDLNEMLLLLEHMGKVINDNDDSGGKVNLVGIDRFKEWNAFVLGCVERADEEDVEDMKEQVETCVEGAFGGEGNEGVVQWIEMCSVQIEKFVNAPMKLELVVGMVKTKFDECKEHLKEVYGDEAQRGEKKFVAVLRGINEQYKDNQENSEIIDSIKNNVKSMLESISSSSQS